MQHVDYLYTMKPQQRSVDVVLTSGGASAHRFQKIDHLGRRWKPLHDNVLLILSGDSDKSQSRQEQVYYSIPLDGLRSPLHSAHCRHMVNHWSYEVGIKKRLAYEETGRQHSHDSSENVAEMTQPCQIKLQSTKMRRALVP